MDRPPFLNREFAFPYLIILLMIGSAVLIAWLFSSFLWSIFLTIVLFVTFESVYKFFIRITKERKTLSSWLTMLIIVFIIVGPLTLLIRQLVIDAIDLAIRTKDLLNNTDFAVAIIQRLPAFVDPVTVDPFFWVENQETVLSLVDRYTGFLDPDKLGSLLGNASSLVFGSMAITISIILNLLLALVLLFFVFRDGDKFYALCAEVIPIPSDRLEIFVSRLHQSLLAVIRGNLFVSVLQGAALGIGLTACGVPRGILFGAIASVFSLVPVVGTAVVWLPAAGYMAIEGNYGRAIFFLIFGPTVYLLLENVLKPKLLDRQLGIHPVLLFFSILGGLAEFGLTGVVIGPILLTIFVTLWSIVPKRAQEAPATNQP